MATITGDTAFGVLAVGGGGRAPPDVAAAAAAAATWWERVSDERWRPRPVLLPPVVLADDPAYWCAGGGLGPGPRNAPGLARAALLALPDAARLRCPRLVVLVAAAPVAPHAWRVAEGGVAVTPGTWVRRYAALPAAAPLGTWAHEMAHLLLDWPDLPTSSCLMGNGARQGEGNDPALPAANLRLRAGWMQQVPVTTDLRAGDIARDEIATLTWESRRIGLSRSPDGIAVEDLDALAAPLKVVAVDDWQAPILAQVFAVRDGSHSQSIAGAARSGWRTKCASNRRRTDEELPHSAQTGLPSPRQQMSTRVCTGGDTTELAKLSSPDLSIPWTVGADPCD